jgi:hypothetical protein
MKYKLADDARPQARLLIIATAITVAVWFIPYAEYAVYPIRLFVTFIHESSHALVALITGGSVKSLTIAADGSGVVYSASSSLFGVLFTSSAGYLGTTIFGVILLYLMRRNVSSQKVLFCLGGLLPFFNFLSLDVGIGSIGFTVAVGLGLSVGLMALALYANPKIANFAIAFLAIQCLTNALSDLKTLFFINAPLMGSDNISTDAGNMATATGVPAIVWTIMWIVISVGVIGLGIRMYMAARSASPTDSVFID